MRRLILGPSGRPAWRGTAVYGVLHARVEKTGLTVFEPGPGRELCRLSLSGALLARLGRRHEGEFFHVGLQAATMGNRPAEDARWLAEEGRVHDAFLVPGLAAEMTEAMAGFTQSEMPRFPEWQGVVRYSPGYPVWPDLAEQKKAFALLAPERIGLSLTETFQLVPEYSTSAIVLPV